MYRILKEAVKYGTSEADDIIQVLDFSEHSLRVYKDVLTLLNSSEGELKDLVGAMIDVISGSL